MAQLFATGIYTTIWTLPLLENYKELIQKIDASIVANYGEDIKKYKKYIAKGRRILNKKGKCSLKYLDLV